ncbi:DUF6476 family protein [Amaricoccus tamworthensis]|uniref:DUF6476 family protein n=1 Tax=Amaricoccus tamworthensis TaxID=57002 RepID=UPI003C7C5515
MTQDIDNMDPNPPEPPRLRQLRWLVNTLMVTLIVGFVVIVVTLVVKLNATGSGIELPQEILIPEGESGRAVTMGTGWVAVVTVDENGQERVRVFDAETGESRGILLVQP